MASQLEPAQKRPRIDQWRGVVEDFVDLKLDEHSFECISQHLQNLLSKTIQVDADKRGMVKKGVLPPLVAILGFPDRRDKASLQHTALTIITMIISACADVHPYYALIQAGAVPLLLSLLKLRLDGLDFYIISLLKEIHTNIEEDVLRFVPGCLESLIQATHCTFWTVRQLAVRLIGAVILQDIPSPQEIHGYIRDLNHLLRDTDPPTVLLTCELYRQIAASGSRDVIQAMLDAGVLPLFAEIENRALQDKAYIECGMEVQTCQLYFRREDLSDKQRIMEREV